MTGCRALSDEEIVLCAESFRGDFHLRDRCFFILGTKLGFRASELLSIKLRDVVKPKKTWVCATPAFDDIRDQIKIHQSKQKRARQATIPPMAKSAIRDWLDSSKAKKLNLMSSPEHALFTSERRKVAVAEDAGLATQGTKTLKAVGYKRMLNVLKANFATCNLPGLANHGELATHALRKTFAKRALALLNGSIADLRLAMGHSSVASTQSYIAVDAEKIKEKLKDI